MSTDIWSSRGLFCNFIKTRSTAIDLSKHEGTRCLEIVAAGDKFIGLASSTIIEDDLRIEWVSMYTRNFRHLGTVQHYDTVLKYYKFVAKVIEIDHIPPLLISISCGMSIYGLVSGMLECLLSTYDCFDIKLPFLTSIKSCRVSNDGKRMIMAGSGRGHSMCGIQRLTNILIFML